MTDIRITVHDGEPPPEALVVDSGLGESNDKAAPLHEVKRLSCFAYLPRERLAGGAVGRTWGECCELQQLWVEEALRGRGIGTALVRQFESAGEARGCRTFYLETFSFQAPSLYRALGYEVAFELGGFAPGVVKYVMVRRARAPGA